MYSSLRPSSLRPRSLSQSARALLGGASLGFMLISGPLSAAPWPVQVLVPMPSNPPTMERFEVSPDPVVTLGELAPVFQLNGQVQNSDDVGDVYAHLADGPDHAYVYQNGGAAVHATAILDQEAPIQVRSMSQVFGSANSLLSALGIGAFGPFTLHQGSLGKAQITIVKADGTIVGPNTTHQLASYSVKVNGIPTFGGGSDVQVVFGANAKVGAFTHALRNVEGGIVGPCKSASQALDDFGERAELHNRFSVLKTGLAQISRVDVSSITLGYYMPDLATAASTLEPVWELKGALVGYDEQGKAASADFSWYEPALSDAELPDLGVFGDPMLDPSNAPMPGSIGKPVE